MESDRQLESVVRLVTAVFGDALVGVYPHGSAVLGGLRPTSDLDVLAVCRVPTTAAQRRDLVEGLLDLSGRRARLGPGRPVELTVLLEAGLRPWRYPPPVEFQYGEWLRDDYERGLVPSPGVDPDVALLLSVALRGEQPLHGPPISTLIDAVPAEDVGRATVAGVQGLLVDLEDDTRNVLLTLARVWTTLATGEIRAKDAAADWVGFHLPPEHRPSIALAREEYLHDREHHVWVADLDAARACARELVSEIDRCAGAGAGGLPRT